MKSTQVRTARVWWRLGIVASRLKDNLHRPAFVFSVGQAEGKDNELKGSDRSIPGVHLQDALDFVAKGCPGVLLRFGCHAKAASRTIDADRLDQFEAEQHRVAGRRRMLRPAACAVSGGSCGTSRYKAY